jgi:hypothetical protein
MQIGHSSSGISPGSEEEDDAGSMLILSVLFVDACDIEQEEVVFYSTLI